MALVSVYDTVHSSVSKLPRDGYAYAGYVGPGNPNLIWTSEDWATLPPGARQLRICALTRWPNGSFVTADIFDCERGNDPPSAAPAWWDAMRSVGGLGCIYSNISTRPAIAAAMGARTWLWWAADPTAQAHQYPGAAATQYLWTPDWDKSVFDSSLFWPVTPPPPDPPPPTKRKVMVVFEYNNQKFLSDGITFRWVDPKFLPVVQFSIVGNSNVVAVTDWRQMGVPADKDSAFGAGIATFPVGING